MSWLLRREFTVRVAHSDKSPIYASCDAPVGLKASESVTWDVYGADACRAESLDRPGGNEFIPELIGAERGTRTPTTLSGPRILSPLRLPVPPPRLDGLVARCSAAFQIIFAAAHGRKRFAGQFAVETAVLLDCWDGKRQGEIERESLSAAKQVAEKLRPGPLCRRLKPARYDEK